MQDMTSRIVNIAVGFVMLASTLTAAHAQTSEPDLAARVAATCTRYQDFPDPERICDHLTAMSTSRDPVDRLAAPFEFLENSSRLRSNLEAWLKMLSAEDPRVAFKDLANDMKKLGETGRRTLTDPEHADKLSQLEEIVTQFDRLAEKADAVLAGSSFQQVREEVIRTYQPRIARLRSNELRFITR